MRITSIVSTSLLVLNSLFLCVPGHAEAPAETPVKIGVILPLTGVTAEYGNAMRHGIELAEEDFPALKQQVNFVFEDAEFAVDKAVSAFHQLTEVQHADMIYVWGVSFCEALAPLAESRGVPLIGQCVSPTMAKGKTHVARFMNYAGQYVDVLFQAIQKRGWKNIGVVIADNPYLEGMFEALKKLADAAHIEVHIVDRYLAPQNDFRSTVTRLKHSNYDAIGVFLSAGQISRFYLQTREAQLSLPSFGTNFFDSFSEIEMARGTMQGAIFVNNHVAEAFGAKYAKRFSSTSQIQWAALAYEFAHHAGRSFEHLADPHADLIKLLINTPPAPAGATGAFRFQSETTIGNYFEFPLSVKEVVNQGTVELAP